jgi:hypothetical protein
MAAIVLTLLLFDSGCDENRGAFALFGGGFPELWVKMGSGCLSLFQSRFGMDGLVFFGKRLSFICFLRGIGGHGADYV